MDLLSQMPHRGQRGPVFSPCAVLAKKKEEKSPPQVYYSLSRLCSFVQGAVDTCCCCSMAVCHKNGMSSPTRGHSQLLGLQYIVAWRTGAAPPPLLSPSSRVHINKMPRMCTSTSVGDRPQRRSTTSCSALLKGQMASMSRRRILLRCRNEYTVVSS